MYDLIQQTHPEWHDVLYHALLEVDANYLKTLKQTKDWLPGWNRLLRAFSLPLHRTHYILFGESPYPRAMSANGYAFWDNAVGSLWSDTGLNKVVNRATSLRNLLKMLLYAREDLTTDFSQQAIARLDKSKYVTTAQDLFERFLQKGFLLLNATLVYSEGKVHYHANMWRPFMHRLLMQLAKDGCQIELLLFGRIANQVPEKSYFPTLVAEHPYNLSFITNPDVITFFKPIDLLAKHEYDNNN